MNFPGPLLITGATSGIGAGLARAFHRRGVQVIAAGRDRDLLARLAHDCPGLDTETLDVRDAGAVAECARGVTTRHPGLDTVINNAGVQRLLDFAAGPPPTPAELDLEIDTNLRGLVHVTAAFLPHLLRRPAAARIVQVSSGLAFIPLVRAPLYSATKAATRAFSIALREQLRGTNVRVIELIPPVVASELHRGQATAPPGAMPLDVFVHKAMRALDSGGEELPVGLAAVLRVAARVAPKRFLKIINRAR